MVGAWRRLGTCWIAVAKQQQVCLLYYITQSFIFCLGFFHVDHPHVRVYFITAITAKTNGTRRIAEPVKTLQCVMAVR